jgi:hypothetical protein
LTEYATLQSALKIGELTHGIAVLIILGSCLLGC